MIEKSLIVPVEAIVKTKLELILDVKLIGLFPEIERRLNP